MIGDGGPIIPAAAANYGTIIAYSREKMFCETSFSSAGRCREQQQSGGTVSGLLKLLLQESKVDVTTDEGGIGHDEPREGVTRWIGIRKTAKIGCL